MSDEAQRPPDPPPGEARFSRRHVLAAAGAGVLGGAVVGGVAGYALGDDDDGSSRDAAPAQTATVEAPASTEPPGTSTMEHGDGGTAASGSQALVSLSAAEGTALVAMLERLVPTDDTGPGATEAMTWRYIDRGLAGPLAETRPIYQAGLAALDELARAEGGESFAALEPDAQDAILERVEKGEAEGAFFPDAATFFATVREHALQGTFGDPLHGGNAGGVGWAILGYPGYRAVLTEADQAYDPEPASGAPSAYDDAMFGLPPAEETS